MRRFNSRIRMKVEQRPLGFAEYGPNMRRAYVAILLSMALVAGCSTSTTPDSAGPHWSKPVQAEGAAPSAVYRSLYGVSCPSSTLCVAVDENGSALFWRSGRWSMPQPVWSGGTLNSVSCPTSTFCTAMSAGGSALTYDGRSWSSPVSVGPSATYEVSCPTITFCAAVGASGAPGGPSTVGTFNGKSWSTFLTSSTGALSDRLMDLSCPTPTLCVAVNLNGHTFTFDGNKWSASRRVLTKGLFSVSCPTSSFCLAVTHSGDFVTFNGKNWSTPTGIPGFQTGIARAVSCSSATECTTVGLSGLAASWHQGHWSNPVSVFPGPGYATVSVSCAKPNNCMTVNDKGSTSNY
jgi:hypothetical protein